MSGISVVRRCGGWAVVVLGLLLGACASGGVGAQGGAGGVELRVRNNLIPPTSLSVYAISERGGGRRLVGVVEPSGTKTLSFDPIGASGQYYFQAETTEGREITSNPVPVTAGDLVEWNLSGNIATVVGR